MSRNSPIDCVVFYFTSGIEMPLKNAHEASIFIFCILCKGLIQFCSQFVASSYENGFYPFVMWGRRVDVW